MLAWIAFILYCGLFLLIAFPLTITIISHIAVLTFYLKRLPDKAMPVRYWLYSFLTECILAIVVFQIRWLDKFFENKKVNVNINNSSRLLFLVHGYKNVPNSLWYFKKQISKYISCEIVTINLKPEFASIDDLAICCKEQIETVCHKLQPEKVHIIGHSMGGLVATVFLAKYASMRFKNICSLTTIGSPFLGTLLSYFAKGENAREMRTSSTEFLQTIQKYFHDLLIPKYQIASFTDNIIIPWQNAFAAYDGEEKLTVFGIGHLGLIFSKEVAKKCAEFCLTAEQS